MSKKRVSKKQGAKKDVAKKRVPRKTKVAKKKGSNKKTQAREAVPRIWAVPSAFDFPASPSAVLGPHEVWYPRSTEDVPAAVALSKGRRTFVRSGLQVATQDTTDGTGGVVIDLTDLAGVTVQGDVVTVEAGATAEAVALLLAKHGLALPLTDEPLRSVVSSVIHERPSCLMRTLGSLSEHVVDLEAVKPSGRTEGFQPGAGASWLALSRASNSVVTTVTFRAAPAADLRLSRATCRIRARTPS